MENNAIEITLQDRAKAVIAKIKPQFPAGGEAKLCFAVFEQAVRDLVSKTTSDIDKSSARAYLTGRMENVSVCGVDVDWVRKVMKDAELLA